MKKTVKPKAKRKSPTKKEVAPDASTPSTVQHLKSKIEFVPLLSLKPYKRNARTHSDFQVDKIARSITEYGFTNPILVDENLQIMAGHGRALAAAKLGMPTVPILKIDYMNAAQKKAYILADNKLTIDADWDLAMLTEELNEILNGGTDLELTGFSQDELDALMKGLEPKDVKNSGSELDVNSFDDFDHQCPKCSYEWNDDGGT